MTFSYSIYNDEHSKISTIYNFYIFIADKTKTKIYTDTNNPYKNNAKTKADTAADIDKGKKEMRSHK